MSYSFVESILYVLLLAAVSHGMRATSEARKLHPGRRHPPDINPSLSPQGARVPGHCSTTCASTKKEHGELKTMRRSSPHHAREALDHVDPLYFPPSSSRYRRRWASPSRPSSLTPTTPAPSTIPDLPSLLQTLAEGLTDDADEDV